MAPNRVLSDRKESGVKANKVRLTYAFTANADGTDKLPPLIIGKAARPRVFNKKSGTQLGFNYRNNAKAWMTTVLYQDWIKTWDEQLQQKSHNILLLQDNFSGHVVPEGLKSIRIENFEPNLTAHVQPMDQGIIWCFKAHYCAQFVRHSINCYDQGIAPSNVYNINQLEAMHLADLAWRTVDVTTIQNCCKKAQILPEFTMTQQGSPLVPISSLLNVSPLPTPSTSDIVNGEEDLVEALDDLVKRGVLQKVNQMNIDSLLNPENKQPLLVDGSEKEICATVQAAFQAREQIDEIGGDDVDGDEHPVPPKPTRKEVLQAMSVINCFVADMGDDLARKTEVVMASLSRNIRKQEAEELRDTVITNFFTRN